MGNLTLMLWGANFEEQLSAMSSGHTDIFIVSETNLDKTFPTAQVP